MRGHGPLVRMRRIPLLCAFALAVLVPLTLPVAARAAETTEYYPTARWPTIGTVGYSPLNTPEGIAVGPTGNIFVADSQNARVQEYDNKGRWIATFGTTPGAGQLTWDAEERIGPKGVTLDGSGNVYVADTANHRIVMYDASGDYVRSFGVFGSPWTNPGELDFPWGMAVDAESRVYVADYYNNTIQVFDPAADPLINPNYCVGVFGADYLGGPSGLAFDADGDLWIADAYEHRVVHYLINDVQPTNITATRDLTWAPEMQYPYGIAFSDAGYLFVADTYYNRVLKLDPATGEQMGNALQGSGEWSALLPEGASVDATDNVYILDTGNNRVVKYVNSWAADVDAPITTSTIPPYWTKGPVTVTLNSYEDTRASGVDYTLYGVNVPSPSTTYTAPFDISAEGTTSICFKAADRKGNVEDQQTHLLRIDNHAPNTTSNAASTWTSSTAPITLFATDPLSGVAGSRYRIGSSEPASYTGPIAMARETSSVLSFWSIDTAGNVESTRTAFVGIDTHPPVTTSDVSTDTYRSFAVVTLHPADAVSGVISTYYSTDGSAPVLPYTGPITITDEGYNTLRFYSVDRAGNAEAIVQQVVMVDGAPPVTSSTIDADWHSTDVTVALSATDMFGVDYSWFRVAAGAVTTYTPPFFTVTGEGLIPVEFGSVDFQENAETTRSATVKIDRTPPVSHHDAVDPAWRKTALSVYLGSEDALSGPRNIFYTVAGSALTTYTGAFDVGGDGPNLVSYYGVDVAGNRESTRTVTVNIDHSPPVTSTDATVSSSIAHLFATDPYSGVGASYYSLDGSFPTRTYDATAGITIPLAGMVTLKYYSSDAVGNSETVHTLILVYDGDPPTTTSSIDGAWHAAPFRVQLFPVDPGSGVAHSFYRVGSGAVTTYTAPGFDISQEGSSTVRFWSVDMAGNIEASSSAIAWVDATLPSSRSTFDTDTVWHKGNQTVTITASDTPSGVKDIWYAFNGSAPATTTGPALCSTNGTNTIQYYATDVSGNREPTRSATVRVDKNAPVTTTNVDGVKRRGNFTVTFFPSDGESGIAATRYKINSSATTTYTAPFEVWSDGTTTIRFWSVDAVGNIEATNTATVMLDNGNPTTTATGVDTLWHDTTRTVTLSATDLLSPIDATYWRIDGGTLNTYATPIVVSADGNHVLEYYSKDSVGNQEDTKTANVKIDRTAPGTASNADAAWHNGSYALSLTASDTLSGLANTYYKVNGGVTTTYTVPFTFASEGTNTVQFWSRDAIGNTEATKTATVKIDKTGPSSSSNSDGEWRTGFLMMSLSSTDTLSGNKTTYYKLNGGVTTTYTAAIDVSDEGVSTFSYWGVDNIGNVEATKTAYVRLDNSPPVTTSDAVATYADVATITLTPTDVLSGPAQTRWRIDGGSWQFGSVATASGIGTHTLEFYSVDAVGNTENVRSAAFVVKARFEHTDARLTYQGSWTTISDPRMSLGAMKNTNVAGGAVNIAFDGTGIDWISTKAPWYGIGAIAIDGSVVATADLYSPTFTFQQRIWSSPVLPAGPHTMRITWTGSANASSTGTNVSIDALDILGTLSSFTDTAAPVSASSIDATWHPGPVIVSLSATDTGSGVATTYYRIGAGTLSAYAAPFIVSAEGTTPVTFYTVDNIGNAEAANTAYVKIDSTGPVTASSIDTSWHEATVTVTLSATDAGCGPRTTYYRIGAGAPATYTAPFDISAEGTTAVSFYSTDALGNTETTKTATVKIDKTRPATTSNADTAWHQGSFVVSLSPTDTLAGVAHTYYRIGAGATTTYTAPFEVTTDGANTVSFFSTDAAGNTEATKTATVKVDGTAPATTSDAVASYTTTATIHLTPADAGSGVASTSWRLDGGALSTGTVVTTTTVGTHTLEFYSVDAVGNTENVRSAAFVVKARFEHTDARLTYQGSWTTISDARMSLGAMKNTNVAGGAVNIAFDGTGIDWISTKAPWYGIGAIAIDGSVVATADLYSPTFTFQQRIWSSPVLPAGPHTMRITWTGSANASSTGTNVSIDALDILGTLSSFTDTAAPVSASSIDATWHPGPVIVSLSATDTGSGVATTYYRIGAGTLSAYAAPFIVSAEGTTPVTFYTVDNIGNAEAANTAYVKIDSTGPVTASSIDTSWHEATVTVTLSPTDAGCGPRTTYYRIGAGAPATYTAPFDISAEGTTAVSFYSTDALGNTETTKTATVKIDKTRPATTSNADTAWHQGSFVVSLSPTDTLAGVAHTYYRIGAGATTTYTAPFEVTTDGANTVSFFSTDAAGNTEATKTATVKVDGTAPATTSDAVASYTTTATIHLTPADAGSGVASTSWRLDGGALSTGTVVTTTTVGTHTLEFYSVDAVGNTENVRSAAFVVKARFEHTDARLTYQGSWTTISDARMSLGAMKNTNVAGGAVNIAFDGTGIDWISTKAPWYGIGAIAIDGSVVATADLYSPTFTFQQRIWSSPVLPAGPHTMRITWTGSANASSTGTNVSIDALDILGTLSSFTDTAAPVSASSIDATWHPGPVIVSLSATDTGSGVATTYYRIGAGTLSAYAAPFIVSAEGTTPVTFYTVDNIGNAEAANTAYVKIDSTGPVTASSIDTSWHEATVTVTLSPTDAGCGPRTTYYRIGAGAPATYTAPFDISAEGTTAVSFYSTDALGNTETTKTATVKIDKTRPATTSNADTAWHQGSFVVSLSPTDTLAGVAHTYYRIGAGATTTYTAPFEVTTDGANTVSFFSTDAAGNTEATKTATVKVDGTAPATTSDAVASYTTTATIHLTPADAGSGVASTSWRLDGGTLSTGTVVTTTTVGTHTLEFYSVDAVGNTENVRSAAFVVKARFEHTDARLTYQGSWTTISDARMSLGAMKNTNVAGGAVNIAFDGTGIDWISTKAPWYGIGAIAIDGSVVATADLYSPTFTFQQRIWSSPVLPAGPHTMRITWTGSANASSTGTNVSIDALDILGTLSSFTDTAAPVSASSIDATWHPGPVIVSLSATDTGSGVATTYYRIGAGTLSAYAAPFIVSAEGTTPVTFYTVDNIGNAEAANTAYVKIDSTGPVTASSIDTSWHEATVTVTLSPTDAGCGPRTTYYRIGAGAPATYTAPFDISAEGTTAVSFYSTDALGNTETTKTATVKIDTTRPATTSNADTAWHQGSFVVSLSPTDTLAGVAHTYYRIGAGATTTYTAPFEVTTDGANTVSFFSTDAAGNTEATKTATVKVDGTAPVTTSNADADWHAGSFTVELTGTDAHAGGVATRYAVNGGEAATYTAPFAVTDDGANEIAFFSIDALGNTEATKTATVKVDGTAPVTTSNADADWHAGSFTVELTGTDAHAGGVATRYAVNGGEAATYTAPFAVTDDGANEIAFFSIDALGNTEATKTATVKVDGTAPVTTSNADADWHAGSFTVELTGTDAHAGGVATRYAVNGGEAATYTAPFAVTDDGANEIAFFSIDALGNTEATKTATVKVDGTAPVTTSNADADWHAGSFTVELTGTDAHAGGVATRYAVNGGEAATYTAPFAVTDDGANEIAFFSIDALGNTEATKTATVKVDGTAPVTTSNADADWHAGSFTVELTGTDAHAGGVATRYAVNGGEAATYTAPFAVTDDGANEIAFFSIDALGNTEATKTATVKVDGTAPVTTSNADADWHAGSFTVELTGTDAHAGGVATRYAVNGGEAATYTAPFAVTDDGANEIAFFSIDALGNTEATKTATVKVDGTAPVTTSNADADWHAGSFTVELTGTDAHAGGVATRYAVNGGEAATYTAPFAVTDDGANEIAFFSIDALGNTEATKTATVKVDGTAPVTTSNADADWHAGSFTVELTGTDAHAGGVATRYAVNGGEAATYTAPFAVTDDGANEIAFFSIDALGNTEATKTATVKVDGTAPVTTSNADADWHAGSFTVELTGTDAHAGGVATRYAVNGGEAATYTAPFAVTDDGANEIAFFSIDALGNTEATKTATVKVDGTAPVTTSNADADWHAGSFTVELTGTDAHAGGVATRYAVNGGEAATYTAPFAVTDDGANEIAFFSIDALGNTEATKTATVKVDGTAPVTTSNADADWHAGSFTVELTGTDAHAGGVATRYAVNGGEAATYTAPFAVTDDGANEIAFFSIDALGNTEATKTATVKVDGTAPVTTSNADADWHAGSFTVELTGTDAHAGGVATRYAVNGGEAATYTAPFAVTDDGANEIAFFSIDALGNTEATKTATVKVDGTAPVTTSSAVSTYTASAAIDLSATDEHSGVADTHWRLDAGSWTTGTVVTTSAIGFHTLEFRSTDTVGNREATRSADFQVLSPFVRYDQSDLRLFYQGAWTPVADSRMWDGNMRSVNATGGAVLVSFTGTGIELISTKGPWYGIGTISIDGSACATADFYAPTFEYQQRVWSSPILADGPHTLRLGWTGSRNASSTGTNVSLDAVDVAGTLASVPDTTPPVTTSDAAGTYELLATIHLSATDDLYGIKDTYYRLDGGAWTTGTVVTTSTVGSHTLAYYSKDNALNTEGTHTATFVVTKTYSSHEETSPMLTYVGAWQNIADPRMSNGNMKNANVAGAKATFAFTGTSVKWTATKAPWYGIADVSIDGSAVASIDLYSSNFRFAELAWDSGALPPGDHIVDIAFTGSRNASSTGTNFNIDRIDVVGTMTSRRFQQTDNNLYFRGAWQEIGDSRMSSATMTNVNASGGAAFIAFNGSSISWLATKAPWYGIANVSVDGSLVASVDLYSPTFAFQRTVWSSTGLAGGGHTMRIDWVGSKNASSTGTNINIDALDVVGILTAMRDTQPPVTSTDATSTYDQTATVTLTATDTMSGVARTRYSVDAAAWTTGSPSVTLSTSIAGPHTIDYQAFDNAGNAEAVKRVSFVVTTPYTRYEETSTLLAFRGKWEQLANSNMSKGALLNTNVPTGTVDIAFTGTAFRWITTKAPWYGKAVVTLDNTQSVTVDLYSGGSSLFLYRQVVWSPGTIADGPHTVRIEWTGTRNPSSTGTNIGLDAIEVIGNLTQAP